MYGSGRHGPRRSSGDVRRHAYTTRSARNSIEASRQKDRVSHVTGINLARGEAPRSRGFHAPPVIQLLIKKDEIHNIYHHLIYKQSNLSFATINIAVITVEIQEQSGTPTRENDGTFRLRALECPETTNRRWWHHQSPTLRRPNATPKGRGETQRSNVSLPDKRTTELVRIRHSYHYKQDQNEAC